MIETSNDNISMINPLKSRTKLSLPDDFELNKILCASNLSENAHYTFGYAVSFANRYDAGIIVLHVAEEISSCARSMVEDILGKNAGQTASMKKKPKS